MTEHRRSRHTRAEVRAYLIRVLRSARPLVLILMVIMCAALAALLVYGRLVAEIE